MTMTLTLLTDESVDDGVRQTPARQEWRQSFVRHNSDDVAADVVVMNNFALETRRLNTWTAAILKLLRRLNTIDYRNATFSWKRDFLQGGETESILAANTNAVCSMRQDSVRVAVPYF